MSRALGFLGVSTQGLSPSELGDLLREDQDLGKLFSNGERSFPTNGLSVPYRERSDNVKARKESKESNGENWGSCSAMVRDFNFIFFH